MNEMTYSITLKGRFSKKIFTDVRGHAFPKDLPNGWIMFTTVDRKHHIVDISKYQKIEFSKEFDYIQENIRNQQVQSNQVQQQQQDPERDL